MKIIANCGCDRWAEVLAQKMFERNKIPCKEAYIVHMDYKWITLDATIRIIMIECLTKKLPGAILGTTSKRKRL